MKLKITLLSEKLLVAAVAVLFVAMLVNCGRYIDIKINGSSFAFPNMPDNDKKVLLRTDTHGSIETSHDLIVPTFLGVRSGKHMSAATFTNDSRSRVSGLVSQYIVELFSGTGRKQSFDSDTARNRYIDELKNSGTYILMSFYCDIPASAFLPSLAKDYESKHSPMYFNVRNLFILPDADGNAYAVAVSSDLDVNIINSAEAMPFNRSDLEAYNDSTGFVSFDYEDSDGIFPVFTSSFPSALCTVKPTAKQLGRQSDSAWVVKLLGVFGLNGNLARNFVSSDKSSLVFIDNTSELTVSDSGEVEFQSSGTGVNISDYLGYYPADNGRYVFSDKVEAVKNIVNMIGRDIVGGDAVFVISDVAYDKEKDTLEFGLKLFVNGVAVTQNASDALFSMRGNYLVSAKLYAVVCDVLPENDVCIPQSIANSVLDKDGDCYYAVLKQIENREDMYSVRWALDKERDE